MCLLSGIFLYNFLVYTFWFVTLVLRGVFECHVFACFWNAFDQLEFCGWCTLFVCFWYCFSNICCCFVEDVFDDFFKCTLSLCVRWIDNKSQRNQRTEKSETQQFCSVMSLLLVWRFFVYVFSCVYFLLC